MLMGIIFCSFTTFSGFCAFANKSLGRNDIKFDMLMYPDDLPSAHIDANGYCCSSIQLPVGLRLGIVNKSLYYCPSVHSSGHLGLGDIRDICCHYWQNIPVFLFILFYGFYGVYACNMCTNLYFRAKYENFITVIKAFEHNHTFTRLCFLATCSCSCCSRY